MIDFFISYAREDGRFARAFVQRLTNLKWDVWIDENDIPPSVPWMTEIQHAIDESMLVVALDSRDWHASDACQIEVGLAEQSRVPILQVTPDETRIDELVERVVQAHRALPEWRQITLQAASSSSIWATAGRKKSLLVRGRPLTVMSKTLTERQEDFSQTATAFIKASAQAATRRLVAGLALGLVAPTLIVGILVSLQVTQTANEKVATNVANATAFAERSTYAGWNIYAGLERSPSDVSGSFTAFYQLFSFLTDRTPSKWDSTPDWGTGPKTAKSPDGSESATVNGAEVVVSTSKGKTTRLPTSSAATSLAWSPDSRWIAVSTSAGADIISVDNAQIISLRGGIGTTSIVKWIDGQHVEVGGTAGTGTWQVFDDSPVTTLDGVRYGTTVDRDFYTVNAAGKITKLDTASRHSEVVPWDVPAGASPTAMDATGAKVVVAFTAAEPFLHLIDIKDNSSREIPIPGCPPTGLSLSTDGSAAYLTCDNSTVNETRVDLTSGNVVARPMQQQLAYGVRVLDDRVLWGGIYGGVFQSGLDLTPQGMFTANAGCNTPIRKFVGASDGSAIFPIGDATGSFGCASRIRAKDPVQVDHLIFDATDGYAIPDAATSADGSLIAYGLSDGRVQVFTASDFYPVYFAQVLPDQVRALSFSRDGKTLSVAGLNGEIVTLPIPFKTAAEGAKLLQADALARLRNAVAWGIYNSTTDSPKSGK